MPFSILGAGRDAARLPTDHADFGLPHIHNFVSASNILQNDHTDQDDILAHDYPHLLEKSISVPAYAVGNGAGQGGSVFPMN